MFLLRFTQYKSYSNQLSPSHYRMFLHFSTLPVTNRVNRVNWCFSLFFHFIPGSSWKKRDTFKERESSRLIHRSLNFQCFWNAARTSQQVAGLRGKLGSTPAHHAPTTFTGVECGICGLLEIARDIHSRWFTEHFTQRHVVDTYVNIQRAVLRLNGGWVFLGHNGDRISTTLIDERREWNFTSENPNYLDIRDKCNKKRWTKFLRSIKL